MDARKKIVKARIGLTFDQPFFGRILLGLLLKEDESCPTGYTDGVVLGYNPSFVDSLDTAGLKFFCCHEVLHVALFHHLRRGARDPKLWNIACDYAVNLLIAKTDGLRVPNSVLLDYRFKDMSAEKIYKTLKSEGGHEEPEDNPGGEVRDMKDEKGGKLSQQDKELEEQKAKRLVSQAVQISKGQGNMPGGIAGVVDALINPAVSWKDILREFVSERSYDDYSWARPNRRYIQQGIIMPSLYNESLGEVCVAVDTSGSMSQSELEKAASEITGILEDFPTASVRVIYCDTSVQGVEVFGQEDFPISLKAKGGGGTRFQPVFDYIGKEGIEPVVMLYMTDMCGRFPDEEPDYPVIWADTSCYDCHAPWGTTVKMEVE